jgi:hypothetical protein
MICRLLEIVLVDQKQQLKGDMPSGDRSEFYFIPFMPPINSVTDY